MVNIGPFSVPRANKRKRLSHEDSNLENGDHNENIDYRDHSGEGRGPQEQRGLRMACPFFKYNPDKYKTERTCPGPGWDDVHRVKEHLYRRHRQAKHRCGRCWENFPDEEHLISHQRRLDPCQWKEIAFADGFNADQERSLKSRKRIKPEPTEAEKWQNVFKILFPHVKDDEIPSPYYECTACQQPETSNIERLMQCESFVIENIPPRLWNALTPDVECTMDCFQRDLILKANDRIKALLRDVFREFRDKTEHNKLSESSSISTGQQVQETEYSSATYQIAFNPAELEDFELGRDISSTAVVSEPNFEMDYEALWEPFTYQGY